MRKNVDRFRMALFGVALTLGMAGPTWGAEERVAECFCLADPRDHTIVRFGCTEQPPPPTRMTKLVRCQTADRFGQEYVKEPVRNFPRLAAGTGECNPCFRKPGRSPDDTIRKLEEEEAKPSN